MLPSPIRLHRESRKDCLEEVKHVLVIGEIISVKQPTCSRDNPDDLVGTEAVVQQMEDSIYASLASTNYHVALVALSYGAKPWV